MRGKAHGLATAAAIALGALAVGLAAAEASAQGVGVSGAAHPPPITPSGIGAAGTSPSLSPSVTPSLSPSLSPSLAPSLPPGVSPSLPAATAPAAVAAPRAVRFTCEVAPYDQSCREPGAPDGGGDDTECNCARDTCYDHYDAAGGYTTRTCQKLQ